MFIRAGRTIVYWQLSFTAFHKYDKASALLNFLCFILNHVFKKCLRNTINCVMVSVLISAPAYSSTSVLGELIQQKEGDISFIFQNTIYVFLIMSSLALWKAFSNLPY